MPVEEQPAENMALGVESAEEGVESAEEESAEQYADETEDETQPSGDEPDYSEEKELSENE